MIRPTPLAHRPPFHLRLVVFVPALEVVGALRSYSNPGGREVWVGYERGGPEWVSGARRRHVEAFGWEDLRLIPARCEPDGHYWVDGRGRGRMWMGDDDPPGNPEYCLLCGMSMWRHAFTECP